MKISRKDSEGGYLVNDQWLELFQKQLLSINELREIYERKQVDAEFIRQRYEDDPVVLALLDAYLAAIKR